MSVELAVSRKISLIFWASAPCSPHPTPLTLLENFLQQNKASNERLMTGEMQKGEFKLQKEVAFSNDV